jgi:hypothetical protein
MSIIKKKKLDEGIDVKKLKGIEGFKVKVASEGHPSKEFIVFNAPQQKSSARDVGVVATVAGSGGKVGKKGESHNRWFYYNPDMPCPVSLDEVPGYYKELDRYRKPLAHSMSVASGVPVDPENMMPGCFFPSLVASSESSDSKKKKSAD